MGFSGFNVFSFSVDCGPVSNLQFQDDVVIRFACKNGTRLALPVHNSNLEDCFRLGRNYTLAVTETVRGSELLHLTPREYSAGDTNVKRNYSSPWCQAPGYASQRIPSSTDNESQ